MYLISLKLINFVYLYLIKLLLYSNESWINTVIYYNTIFDKVYCFEHPLKKMNETGMVISILAWLALLSLRAWILKSNSLTLVWVLTNTFWTISSNFFPWKSFRSKRLTKLLLQLIMWWVVNGEFSFLLPFVPHQNLSVKELSSRRYVLRSLKHDIL